MCMFSWGGNPEESGTIPWLRQTPGGGGGGGGAGGNGLRRAPGLAILAVSDPQPFEDVAAALREHYDDAWFMEQ
ncbi:hypothetical protein [Streptomyces sp. NPDC093591]|uniref:hypothetical protein n=1 Tax=Streptomyces sp. NPDC093591 TaxID=3366044 RepID=UPI0037F9557D